MRSPRKPPVYFAQLARLLYALCIIFGVAYIGRILRHGTTWLKHGTLDVWVFIGVCALLAALLLGVPTALVRASRPIGAAFLYGATIVIAFSLWVYSLVVVADAWGKPGVITGVALLGVGVYPVALVAAVMTKAWVLLGGMLVAGVLVVGLNRLGRWTALRSIREWEENKATRLHAWDLLIDEEAEAVVAAETYDPDYDGVPVGDPEANPDPLDEHTLTDSDIDESEPESDEAAATSSPGSSAE